jgi:hypothetical protein
MPNVEIGLWTASTDDTAIPVVQMLEQGGQIFDELIVRDSRWFGDVSSTYAKRLENLGRSMSHVLIVDNTPAVCYYNPQNALIVKDFTGPSHRDGDYTVENLRKAIAVIDIGLRTGHFVPGLLELLVAANKHVTIHQQSFATVPPSITNFKHVRHDAVNLDLPE